MLSSPKIKSYFLTVPKQLKTEKLDISVGDIVTAFVENGLTVSEAYVCEESLEDYFKRVTGGDNRQSLLHAKGILGKQLFVFIGKPH